MKYVCNVMCPNRGNNLKDTEHEEETQTSSKARTELRQWRGVNQAL